MIDVLLLLGHIPFILLIYLARGLDVAVARGDLVGLLQAISHQLVVVIAAHLGVEGTEVVLSHVARGLVRAAQHLVVC